MQDGKLTFQSVPTAEKGPPSTSCGGTLGDGREREYGREKEEKRTSPTVVCWALRAGIAKVASCTIFLLKFSCFDAGSSHGTGEPVSTRLYFALGRVPFQTHL